MESPFIAVNPGNIKMIPSVKMFVYPERQGSVCHSTGLATNQSTNSGSC
ncbi:unnamed protein product [Oppiella nova]|uniref:Uncharacterized protein n=1 Tax=Oppiella nova TaxID=334625 RepID=A0A7R9QWX2_9ACAR|nr:unnamed protein product [Oppiella nova]CAG2178624.1 unnamed protein product [Oppiella nova]